MTSSNFGIRSIFASASFPLLLFPLMTTSLLTFRILPLHLTLTFPPLSSTSSTSNFPKLDDKDTVNSSSLIGFTVTSTSTSSPGLPVMLALLTLISNSPSIIFFCSLFSTMYPQSILFRSSFTSHSSPTMLLNGIARFSSGM
ncbi:141aa long hypothetical protein [Pyrococcus horikoshii OT3]|uniref:Uncharacterized protein n=1 Tax=Pyrococcus horikoshii (strain ATCC 700860 / DSM 12428 / JCM 9974 / NBRC 100139 / OT-3) TaxID=70601 RepID=O58631_PYRHO|nr:141aa long hypothetical protein [Pyrococcus horikoshii OT3]